MEKSYKIIIIEDEEYWQKVIVEMLSDPPYKTSVFSDYESAEKALKDQLFHFAIVDLRLLMDYHKNLDHSDEWGGWKVLQLIKDKSLNSNMGTMVLTWHDLKVFKDKATKDLGAIYFMSKRELDEDEFINTIQHYFKYRDTSFNENPLKK